MKKLYIVCIDYKASYKPMFTEYKVLESESLLDAMSEAEQYDRYTLMLYVDDGYKNFELYGAKAKTVDFIHWNK